MKEEWVTVDVFLFRSGMTKSALYTKISRDRRVGAPDFDSKYKLQGETRLINMTKFEEQRNERNEIENRFSSAYFKGIAIFKKEYTFARHVAEEMGISPWTVSGYFRHNFLQEGKRPATRRLQYIEAMEAVIKAYEPCL